MKIGLKLLITMLLCIFFTDCINAQTQLAFKIDNAMRNNKLITIYDGNIIYGKDGDAIRLSGTGLTGDVIRTIIADNEYTSTVNNAGEWFVLFSITNLKKESYSIEISNSNQEISRIILYIGEDSELKSNIKTESDDSYHIILITFSIFILFVIFIWNFISKKFLINKNINKRKLLK